MHVHRRRRRSRSDEAESTSAARAAPANRAGPGHGPVAVSGTRDPGVARRVHRDRHHERRHRLQDQTRRNQPCPRRPPLSVRPAWTSSAVIAATSARRTNPERNHHESRTEMHPAFQRPDGSTPSITVPGRRRRCGHRIAVGTAMRGHRWRRRTRRADGGVGDLAWPQRRARKPGPRATAVATSGEASDVTSGVSIRAGPIKRQGTCGE